MTLTNSKSVALERRMDLASLFCMIGRHGPAVAVAVLAMISVLAAFVIYRRTVRGKRGKATAAAAGRDAKSRGEEPDAAVNQEEEEEEEEEEADMIPAEATEVEDGASPDLPKDPDLSQNHLKIRQRCAAAVAAEDSFTALKAVEKKPPLHSSPRCDNGIPEYRHTASGGGQSFEWDMKPHRAAEMRRDEVGQHQHLSEPEPEKEDVFDSHQDVKVETVEDEIEAIHHNDSCLKESTDDENKQEEEQVFKAETTDEGSPHINTRQEEENVQCVMKNVLSQTPRAVENGDHVKLQDDKTTREEKDSEPINGVKDEHEEARRCPDSTVYANYCRDSNVTAEEEEEKDEEEEEEEEEDECVDRQLIAQHTEIRPTTQEETRSPSSLQQLNEQHDQTEVLDDEGGVNGQVIEEDLVKDIDQLRDLTAAECDAHLADGQVKDKEMTNGDVAACVSAGERDGSSPLLTRLNQTSELEKFDGGDEGLPGVVICPVSPPFQQPQKKRKDVKDEMSPLSGNEPDQREKNETVTAAEEQNTLVEDHQAPSLYKDQQGDQVIHEDFERVIEGVATSPDIDAFDAACVTSRTVAAACDDDQVTAPAETEEAPRPQLSSVCHDQLSGLNDEEFDESNITSDPDVAAWDDGDVTSVVNHEEISCPPTPPVCQNQQRGQTVNNEALDKDTGTETVAGDGRTFIIPVIVEDVSCPPLPSLYQNQQSDQMKDNEGLEEESVTADTAAVDCGGDEESSSSFKDQQRSQTVNNEDYTAEEMIPPINHLHSLSFDQREQRGHDMDDISSPGADEESGVSSMAFSPDLEEPSEHLGRPVMDFGHHLIEAHHDIFSKSVSSEDGSIPSTGFEDKATCVSFGGNEDVFGQDIEDSYHEEFDQFTTQIAASIGSRTDEAGKQAEDKDVDVAEMKEEKKGIRLEKKEKARAENEEDETYERTEISIMEATMDSNEWIEDINYHVPPWMNLSLKSLDQDHTKNEKLQQDFTATSATTGAVGTDARDVDVQFPSVDKQSSTLSVADDNNKKVAAVLPMPQNVNVSFCVHYLAGSPHQTVAVTGNQQELGSWKGFVPLERAKDGYWAGVIGLPAESRVEWKFVLVDNGEVCRWEECGNRYLETGCGDDLYVHKWWGLL